MTTPLGSGVGEDVLLLVQVSAPRYRLNGLALPGAIDSASVTVMPEAVATSAAVNGPLPVPLVVPLASTVPLDVERIEKLNWSVGSIRAPWMILSSLIEAKRTASITPCNPPARSTTVTWLGRLVPAICAPISDGCPPPAERMVLVPMPVSTG